MGNEKIEDELDDMVDRIALPYENGDTIADMVAAALQEQRDILRPLIMAAVRTHDRHLVEVGSGPLCSCEVCLAVCDVFPQYGATPCAKAADQ